MLRKSLAYGGLARVLHEGAKGIEKHLCKIDSEGKAKKVTGCSGVVVKDFGEEHEAYNVVLQHVKSQ
ncbi:hypothetical protein JHK82_039250 [Glycine max]|nr:hypothetical protein JHK86_039429 [Glycine max]KAG4965031.1 hypothetical protein JHK85_040006 [Glycine max]KAG5110027.1 hypothetical protein JHK82_039250 [Glycine max]KHN17188.1 40S ribosomal protein S12 [Glycine soja]